VLPYQKFFGYRWLLSGKSRQIQFLRKNRIRNWDPNFPYKYLLLLYIFRMVPRRGRMQLSEFNDLQILRTFFSSRISLCFLTKGPHDIPPLGLEPPRPIFNSYDGRFLPPKRPFLHPLGVDVALATRFRRCTLQYARLSPPNPRPHSDLPVKKPRITTSSGDCHA